MATFVLLHGSYHGGWSWKKVAPLLRAAGHDVYTPTFTGLGERSHLVSREVGHETHVQDILSLVEFEDLSDVVLAGHSYGCPMAAAIANRIPEKIRHVVYLDGGVPRDGQSVWDLFDARSRQDLTRRMRESGSDWLLPPPPATVFGLTDPVDLAWVDARLTAMPVKCWTDPISLTNPARERLPRTQVVCTLGRSPESLERVRARAAANGGEYREIPTGHDLMLTMPEETAEILLAALNG
jgi:pimeloyl-ACP methyl ester carboxylesterase